MVGEIFLNQPFCVSIPSLGHSLLHVSSHGFAKGDDCRFITSFLQHEIQRRGRTVVLLFRPFSGARHDVFVHLRVRGRVFLIDQFFHLLHAGIIQFPDQPVGFRQLAVENFVRQDGRARLRILEE